MSSFSDLNRDLRNLAIAIVGSLVLLGAGLDRGIHFLTERHKKHVS